MKFPSPPLETIPVLKLFRYCCLYTRIFGRLSYLSPWCKGVLAILQSIFELREVSEQHVFHRGVLDPVEAFLGVHFGVPLTSNKSVTLQAPRCHHNENAESRFAESKPGN